MLAHQGAPIIHLSCTRLPPAPDSNTGVTDTWHHAAFCISARDLRTQVFLPAEQTLYVLNHLPIAPCGLWFLFLGYSEVDSMGWSRDISLTQGSWGEEVADERWKGEVQATPWQLTPLMAHSPLPNSPFIYGLMNRFFFSLTKPTPSWSSHLQWSHHLGTITIRTFEVAFHTQLLLNILCSVTFNLIALGFSDWVEDNEKFQCWTSPIPVQPGFIQVSGEITTGSRAEGPSAVAL